MSLEAIKARPWTAFYTPDMKHEIEHAPFRTIGAMVTATAKLYADQYAFTAVMPNGMFGNLTFAEADRMSDAFAVYLREVAGLKTGDRVALQVPNGLAFPIAAFGVFKAGCVLVNVNPLYTAEEMGRLFADAKPAALVIVDMFADKLPEALKAFHIPTVIVTRVAEYLPTLQRMIVGIAQKYVRKQIPKCEVPHIRLTDAVKLGREHLDRERITVMSYHAELDGNSLACLQYTGGTTGVSKGAMLTHGNILMNMAQALEMCGSGFTRGKEVVLTALPMYHIFAFTVNLLGFWWYGGRNILIPSPRPLTNLQKAFENYPVTLMVGVNTLFNGLLNETWFRDHPPKALKRSLAGGMALQTSVAERWEQLTGTPVVEGYGLTESSPVLTFNPFGKSRPGTIGIPIPSTDVKCVDDAGHEVPMGQPGELIARGPQIMAGYWQRPDETAKVIKNGWLHTGDIATMDEDGYFRIVDRKKDMILVSGFNVFPNEVEDALAKHPGVMEVAVVGVPDGAAGEAVKAFIVKKDPALEVNDIRGFCKEHLTGYKVPKFVEFRSELPKSNVGKILRKDLRSEELAKAAGGKKAS
jgi:long-chain acyl-CoA synthetase